MSSSRMAALWGTTVSYTDTGYTVVIETTDNRVIVITKETFEYLYHRLDDFTAALKDDCIEYVVYDINQHISNYPYWFKQAMEEGWITNEYTGSFIFLGIDGEIAMSHGSVILRNFMGDLRYMEANDFDRYYDTAGGILE